MALPDYGTNQSPFYNPASNYGWDPTFWNSELSKFWYDQNPEFEWTHWLATRGLGGMDQQSGIARGLYGRATAGYGAARGHNMDLSFRDYLSNLDPQGIMANMGDEEKGINRGRYQGRDRWALR